MFPVGVFFGLAQNDDERVRFSLLRRFDSFRGIHQVMERDLLIFSPYFVPGDDGVMVLTDLEKRGVRVRVLTNSLASLLPIEGQL